MEPQFYEMILLGSLKSDKTEKSGGSDKSTGFLSLVRTWPPELYNVGKIVNILVEELLVRILNTLNPRHTTCSCFFIIVEQMFRVSKLGYLVDLL